MFSGEYSYTLDSKGRLTLPAKFRDELSHGVFVTRGLDGCLFVFADADWRRFTERLSEELPITKQKAREFSRFFYSGAVESRPDGQGRVLIPEYLRQYADLDTDVRIIGAANRLELWNPERWEQMLASVSEHAEEIAEHFGHITI
ncbi:MAG: division/cell wall cluster transcriptional repressor MraZ [Anaerolineae bacterium]|nr:division/cell wall cluster transcriptional repressor MraZ [Anaerolineae bacterium]